MRILLLALLVLGAPGGVVAGEPGWLGAGAPEVEEPDEGPSAPSPEASPTRPAHRPGDGPALAARRVMETRRKWPGPGLSVPRRMELVWQIHDLEAEGYPRAAGILRRHLRRFERAYCDRRDPEQEAASIHLSPERVAALRVYLDAHRRLLFERPGRGPEPESPMGIFRGIPICFYRH